MYLFVRASICLTFVMFEFYCSISWTACACMLIAQIFMKSYEKKRMKKNSENHGLNINIFFHFVFDGIFSGKKQTRQWFHLRVNNRIDLAFYIVYYRSKTIFTFIFSVLHIPVWHY